MNENPSAKGDLYICDTPYHLLVAIIKAMQQGQKPSLMLSNKFIRSRKIIQNLKASGLFVKIYGLKDRTKNLMDYMEYHKYRWLSRRTDKKKKMEQDFPSLRVVASQRVFLFNDTTIAGYYLQLLQKPYHLLEDGRNNYAFAKDVLRLRGKNKWVEARDYIWHSRHLSMGQSPLVRSLEVHERVPSFRYMKDELPLHVVNKEDMFANLSNEQKRMLLQIFDASNLVEWGMRLKGKRCTLLLTQPLKDLDPTMTTERQQEIYLSMVQEYGAGALFVKLHPRDKVSYDSVFPGAHFLPADFPAELLGMAEISFAVVLAGISTAAESIPAEKKIVFSLDDFCRKYELQGEETLLQ
ncbi:MAG: glycosyltransferase family 52 protein [Lachnospiraceae bacterium]|nr:glycosyltransferase family 52 protein [Lachnospiraceae bacterium]